MGAGDGGSEIGEGEANGRAWPPYEPGGDKEAAGRARAGLLGRTQYALRRRLIVDPRWHSEVAQLGPERARRHRLSHSNTTLISQLHNGYVTECRSVLAHVGVDEVADLLGRVTPVLAERGGDVV